MSGPEAGQAGTMDLLTRAADAAGRHAETLGRQQPTPSELALKAENRAVQGAFFNEAAHRARIGDPASGADHWRALSTMLRRQRQLHQPYESAPGTTRCAHCGWRWSDGCPSLRDLRPLAEQVLRDMGEMPGG